MERVEITHDLQEETTWKSCCLRSDRQLVVYLGQLSFSLSVLGICTTVLILALSWTPGPGSKRSQRLYWVCPRLVYIRPVFQLCYRSPLVLRIVV